MVLSSIRPVAVACTWTIAILLGSTMTTVTAGAAAEIDRYDPDRPAKVFAAVARAFASFHAH